MQILAGRHRFEPADLVIPCENTLRQSDFDSEKLSQLLEIQVGLRPHVEESPGLFEPRTVASRRPLHALIANLGSEIEPPQVRSSAPRYDIYLIWTRQWVPRLRQVVHIELHRMRRCRTAFVRREGDRSWYYGGETRQPEAVTGTKDGFQTTAVSQKFRQEDVQGVAITGEADLGRGMPHERCHHPGVVITYLIVAIERTPEAVRTP